MQPSGHPITRYHAARKALKWLWQHPQASSAEILFHASALHAIGKTLWAADGPHCRYAAVGLLRVARAYGLVAALTEWNADLELYPQGGELGAPWEWRRGLDAALAEEVEALRRMAWRRMETWYSGGADVRVQLDDVPEALVAEVRG